MRRLHAGLICLMVVSCWRIGSLSADDLEALQKAKETFESVKSKQEETLKGAFDKGLKDATKAGKLEEVQTLQRELQSFQDASLLPESPRVKLAGQKYGQAMKLAFGKLETAFERAIKSETKAEHIAEAQALQDELDELRKQYGDGAQDRQLIDVISATWKYDQRAGKNDGKTEDVKEKVQQALKKGGLEIGLHTLGDLSGIAATKSLYAQLKTGKTASVTLRLSESSKLELGELSQSETKAKGMKFGSSTLELLSASWVPKEGDATVDATADYFRMLKSGPVEMSSKSFPNVPLGKFRFLDVTFRVVDRRIKIRQSDASLLSVSAK